MAYITEDTLPAYKEYLELDKQIKVLTARKEVAKKKIRALHDKLGLDEIVDAGFKSLISKAERMTLISEEIEKELGKPIPEHCKKVTPYERLLVTAQVIAG